MPRRIHISSDIVKLLMHRSGVLAHPRLSGGVVAAVSLAGVGVWLWVRSRRPSAEEVERRRREWLAAAGRLTDGSLTDARTLAGEESHDPAA